MPLPGEGLPLPGNNQPPCIPHVRLKYFKQKIPNFKVALEPPVCPLPKEPLESKICKLAQEWQVYFQHYYYKKPVLKISKFLNAKIVLVDVFIHIILKVIRSKDYMVNMGP
ncbi:L-amino-acid oxidase [Gigaspora margarita]|nr:L-amino-acid oxidase [Gigaspora margarita]